MAKFTKISIAIIFSLFLSISCGRFLLRENNSTDPDPIPDTIENLLTILNGFSNTSGLYTEVPALVDLRAEDYLALREFFDAFNIFKNITKDNWVDVIQEGSAKISVLFTSISHIISQSTKLSDQTLVLFHKIYIQISDKNYLDNLVKNVFSYNIFQVMQMAQQALNDATNNDYNNLGRDLGKLFRIIFIFNKPAYENMLLTVRVMQDLKKFMERK